MPSKSVNKNIPSYFSHEISHKSSYIIKGSWCHNKWQKVKINHKSLTSGNIFSFHYDCLDDKFAILTAATGNMIHALESKQTALNSCTEYNTLKSDDVQLQVIEGVF